MPKSVYLFIGGREWDALLGLWTHSFSLVRIVALLMRPWTHWVEFLKKSLHEESILSDECTSFKWVTL